MACQTFGLWLALLILLCLVGTRAFADKHPGKHAHDHQAAAEAKPADHGEREHEHHHQHDVWVTPPADYASARSTRWDDPAAISRGQQLFQTNCLVCHGADGKGTGPAAKALEHPPADLTNHFHRAPGDGDAYLFWRVSEGGQVEPFKAMESAMPAFKTFLTEDQRWDVLAYVHAQFHRGFTADTMAPLVRGEGKVIAVVPANQQIVIEHGAIKGFMGAMTMGYKVNPPALLDGFTAGEAIRFTIDTQQKAIVQMERLQP